MEETADPDRAERLFKEKYWRFQIGAMERFSKEDGYVARHLVDMQYLSRLGGAAIGESIVLHVVE